MNPGGTAPSNAGGCGVSKPDARRSASSASSGTRPDDSRGIVTEGSGAVEDVAGPSGRHGAETPGRPGQWLLAGGRLSRGPSIAPRLMSAKGERKRYLRGEGQRARGALQQRRRSRTTPEVQERRPGRPPRGHRARATCSPSMKPSAGPTSGRRPSLRLASVFVSIARQPRFNDSLSSSTALLSASIRSASRPTNCRRSSSSSPMISVRDQCR